jgi:ClpP class serine protease
MALADRIKLYSELELERNRPLIVYVTSGRSGPNGQVGHMDADAIPELCDQLEKLPEKVEGLDLLIVSDGGDPMVAWRSITLLRERTDHLAVLIPQGAYSAATLLALGANEILMHPNGNLGPVDPQIRVRTEKGDKSFGFEDMAGFLAFVREEVKLTDQEQVRTMFELFCREVGTIPVGVAATDSQVRGALHLAV